MNLKRIEQMQRFSQKEPDDPFPRYAPALEYDSAGEMQEAIDELDA